MTRPWTKTEMPIFRWFIFTLGVVIMSFGVALMIRAELGIAPWDVLHVGLQMHFGLTVGTWTIIMGLVLLTASVIISKERPKLGAYINMIFVGVFVDIFLLLLETPASIQGQTIMLLAGILVMGFGIGVYISPRMGAGPRDSVMLAISEKTGMAVARVRAVMEVSVLFIGWLLGGPVFIGTLLFSVTIGHVSGVSLTICQNWMDRLRERGMRVENIY
ncbi:YczE/YyaS/YitT family protein [Salisediminibacterium halotolerans]|uniref:YczE/YyaS/YitT family protein n=1 Tax=Salisediminibacterium halotolerans TaxID=517425 RepID=UPI000EB19E16|nr:YitT family protein [Salisediminibacterium halotolerans]RLJ78368.1 hypothetical protein BCL39_0840 [Actinophytocola xinjiangensis]RPE88290.1 hypothetical protein EDD67_0616 [Salisediminibacterium halotolerans]TWG37344.1 hypothetical protein BCL52_0838 [Salisediminibacterium halotolerans]GEL06809.1 putative membrane protein YczE [Salisediminibacterium halotolerans]